MRRLLDRIRSLRRSLVFLWDLRVLPPRVARFQWRARRAALRAGDLFSLNAAARPQKLALILNHARGCHRVAELGTGTGWTALSLLLDDPQRQVVTYDPQDRAERARYLELAGRHARERFAFIHAPGASGPNEQQCFDLLFIDSSHGFEETLGEFNIWRPALSYGARVIFDDFGHPEYPGVRQAVEQLGLTGHSENGLFLHQVGSTEPRADDG